MDDIIVKTKKTYDGIHVYNTEAALSEESPVCPVCGKALVEIFCDCPICGWKNDHTQDERHPDDDQGQNRYSLNEAKKRYEIYGKVYEWVD